MRPKRMYHLIRQLAEEVRVTYGFRKAETSTKAKDWMMAILFKGGG